MRRLIIGLIVGAAMGYHWGYDEGSAGKPSVASRMLDHFGTTTIKAAQDAQNKRVEEAARP
jgi:CO/xanthine dehydrogenase Mo-binding subunit